MSLAIKRCPDCGAKVSENWLKRHQNSDCEIGAKGATSRKYRKHNWSVRPGNGEEIFVWNRFLERWECVTYLMEDGGTLIAPDGWRGKVSRFGKSIYPEWSE